MKIKNLKYIFLGVALFFLTPTDTFGQLFTRHPTNVRYIGGGFNDKRPYFNTLEAALNDVKSYATAQNPYAFFVASDTIQIADWDSVFTESGLTMKDSIDVYYVAEGKIKWFGFGQGGGGTGITSLTAPANQTTYYNLWTWTGQTGLSTFYNRLAENQDSIDLKLWELIIYTDSVTCYIENDTLKVRESWVTALIAAEGTRPDTTIIAYKTIAQVISGNWEFDGDITIDAGSLRLPSANNNTGVSRVIWSSGNIPYWSGSGAVGDTSIIALLNPSTGTFRRDSVVAWPDLQDEVQDSFAVAFTDTFTTTLTADTVTVSGLTASDVIAVGGMGSTYNANDILFVQPGTGQFIVTRNAAGTSGLKYWWIWTRKQTL